MSRPPAYVMAHGTAGGLPPQLEKHQQKALKQKKARMKKPPPTRKSKSGKGSGVTVAIRMRPSGTGGNRVWKVLPHYNAVTQTTSAGKALKEPITGQTFFTFDKAFGEDTPTIDVYNGVAKGLVESVVCEGRDAAIFAYGATSSGKTHTMQGSGPIDAMGIVQMAAKDIFHHVCNSLDVDFVVRVSFVEIYKEQVCDLLGGNAILSMREDPESGTYVNAVQEIVDDYERLVLLLFLGEKNRVVRTTKKSSRSTSIFRITIESCKKTDENDMSASNSADDDVRISSLYLVDLAGSESHVGWDGVRDNVTRSKTNRSLLSLLRAVGSDGQQHKTRVGDCKLSCILQPFLTETSRVAVICCASPSEFRMKETCSTFLFATRARMVNRRTKADDGIDDQSVFRRLTRDLGATKHSAKGSRGKRVASFTVQTGNVHMAKKNASNSRPQQVSSKGVKLVGIPVADVIVRSEKQHIPTDTTDKAPAQLGAQPRLPKALNESQSIELRDLLSMTSEIKVIEGAYNAKVAQTKKLEEKVSTLTDSVDRLESALKERKGRIAKLKKGKAVGSDSAEVWRKKLATAEAKISHLKSHAETKTLDLEDENKKLTVRLEKLELSQNAREEELVEQFNMEKEGLLSRIQELESLIETRDVRLRKLESKERKRKKQKHKTDTERAKLEESVKEYRLKLESTEGTIAQLNAKAGTISKLEEENKQLKAQLEQVEPSHKNLEEENFLLVTEIESMRSQIKKLEDLVKSKNDHIKRLEEGVKRMTKRMQMEQAQIHDYQRKLAICERTISMLKTKDATLSNLESYNRELVSRLRKLEKLYVELSAKRRDQVQSSRLRQLAVGARDLKRAVREP